MATQNTPTAPTRWLSVSEAADYLGMNHRWMRRAVDEGRIPYRKFGRLVRFDVADLDAYASAQRYLGGKPAPDA